MDDSLKKNESKLTEEIDLGSKIKSKTVMKKIFSLFCDKKKLNIIIYNKKYQNILDINIEHFKKNSGKFKIMENNKFGKEYDYKEYISGKKILLFEGEYINKKRNGYGKEYKYNELIYKGNYVNGKRNGYGEEYKYNELIYNGDHLNDKRNGFGMEYKTIYLNLNIKTKEKVEEDYYYKIIKDMEYYFNKKEKGIEYHSILIKDGYYSNDKPHGKGVEYYYNNNIKFIGEYLNGKRYNGKGYNSKGDLLYELKNGNGYVIEYYDINKLKYLHHFLDDINEKGKDHILFEGEYLNGEKNGKGIEYYFNGNKNI